jgi:hypothetical protein
MKHKSNTKNLTNKKIFIFLIYVECFIKKVKQFLPNNIRGSTVQDVDGVLQQIKMEVARPPLYN